MSRISEVIKNKNKMTKALKEKHKREMSTLRDKSAYKAKLYNELKHIDVILEEADVESVVIKIPDNLLAQFNSAIFSEDLVGYDVVPCKDDPTKFYVKRKYVSF